MNAAQRRAQESLHAHILTAGGYWPTLDLSDVHMTFDQRGMSGGCAFWKTGRIKLNDGLLRGDTLDRMCKVTIPHELAHIIAGRLHGKRQGHGRAWQRVMRTFGLEPERCHDMEVQHLKTRHERSYPAVCGCGDRRLSVRRGNRMKRTGCGYQCRTCRQRITLTGGVAA